MRDTCSLRTSAPRSKLRTYVRQIRLRILGSIVSGAPTSGRPAMSAQWSPLGDKGDMPATSRKRRS